MLASLTGLVLALWITEPPARSSSVVLPDLGAGRYHDPPRRKEAWLGFDLGGVAVPGSTSGLGRPVWSARLTPSYALALLSRLAIGGRHELSWYDAGNVRLRVHGHALELSGRLLGDRPRLRDRPAIGVEIHDVALAVVDGVGFRVGGVRDVALQLGYGLEHQLTPRLQLGWRAYGRQAWVFRHTQRQARISIRLALLPWASHRFSLELLGFYVNRDRDQAGEPVPRNTVHGQVLGEYAWMGARGVGFVVGGRYCTSFLSGEAPIYEIRTESLRTHYGEAFAGLRVAWQ
jgi:hypothetical protein